MILYAIICTLTALCYSRKDFEHLFFAIAMSIGTTPIGGYFFYKLQYEDEIKAEREARRLQKAIRREQAVKDWYLSRIPDAEADRINSLPTHAERLRAAQQAIDRIIEDDRHDPHAPEPPFRPPFY
jgi:hypothetical protein